MFSKESVSYTHLDVYKRQSYNYAPDWGDYATWGAPNGTWDYVKNIRINESALENASINNKSFKRRRENSEILIRYNTTVAHDHEISALGGFTTSYYNENYFDVTRKGMSDWSLTQLKTATAVSYTHLAKAAP